MDNIQTEFRIAHESLTRQAVQEVKNLRECLNVIDPDALENDDGTALADAVERIIFACEGIRKIGYAQEYVEAWEENGDPPQLSYRNDREPLKSFYKPDDRA